MHPLNKSLSAPAIPDTLHRRNRGHFVPDEASAMPIVPSLKFISAQVVGKLIEKGFKADNPDLAPADSKKQCVRAPKEVRGRLFEFDARKALKRLSNHPTLAELALLEASPMSTAIYCAMSTIPSLESFDLSRHSSSDTLSERTIDFHIASLVGPVWQNLHTVVLRRRGVTTEFFETLAMGPAKQSLTSLDISETFVQDSAFDHICQLANLRKLFLNQCIFITEAAIRMVGNHLRNIKILSLNFVDLPLSKLLPILVGESPEDDPLPRLEKVYFESHDWERQVDSILWFIAHRKHIESLRICAALPKLDLGAHSLDRLRPIIEALFTLSSLQRLPMLVSDISRLSSFSNLRILRLQNDSFKQPEVDTISHFCPALTDLILSSLTVDAKLSFANMTKLKNMQIPDARVHAHLELPKSLECLIVTFSVIERNPALAFLRDIGKCSNLDTLHIYSAELDALGVGFEPHDILKLVEVLPHLKHLSLDADLFATKDGPITLIPIRHRELKVLEMISSDTSNAVPFVDTCPCLASFSTNGTLETEASLPAIFRRSPLLQNLKLRFPGENISGNQLKRHLVHKHLSASNIAHQMKGPAWLLASKKMFATEISLNPRIRPPKPLPEHMHQRQPARPATPWIPSNFYSLKNVTSMEINNFPDDFFERKKNFQHLTSLKLSNCSLPSETVYNIQNVAWDLRVLELRHCDLFSSFSLISGSKLSKLLIDNCGDLEGAVILDSRSFPNLEIISILNSEKITSIEIFDLERLVSIAVRNIYNLNLLRISNVELLWDLACDGVSCRTVSVAASNLRRCYFDLYGIQNEVNSFDATLEIHISAPSLRRLWLQLEDVNVEEMARIFSEVPELEELCIPLVQSEHIKARRDYIRQKCPLLKSCTCSDEDVSLV